MRDRYYIKNLEDLYRPYKPKKRKRCQMCGILSWSVRRWIDPWTLDTQDVEVKINLCPNCLDSRIDNT